MVHYNVGFIPVACDYTNDSVQIKVQIKDLQALKPDSGLWTNQHVGQMLFVVLRPMANAFGSVPHELL